MDISGKRNGIVILLGALWKAIMLLGWNNNHVPAMILSVVLMFLHMILGVAKQGKISKRFLLYPLGVWAILWSTSFLLSNYYANKFAGVMPSFKVLGLHPSFAPTMFLYYIGGMLSLTVGFVLFIDDRLSSMDWDNFLETVKKNKEEEHA